MRPGAATFCSTCGQDLREGAPLGATAGKTAPPRRSGGKAAASATGVAPEEREAGPTQQRTISRPPSAQPEGGSFTERYRGTDYETPESKVANPSRGWRGALTRRYGRVIGAATLVVLVAAVALAGASSFLLAGSSASPSPGASGTVAPSGTPPMGVLAGGSHFTSAEQAQIAYCIAAVETRDLDAQVAALQAAVKAAQHAAVATGAADLGAAATEMRLAAAEMTNQGALKAYASGYDAGLRAVIKAAASLATAAGSGSAKGEGAALTALLTAQKQVHAGDAPRAKALQADPTLACAPAG